MNLIKKMKTNKMVTFICQQKDLDSGQFTVEMLKTFTINTGTRVVIPGYAVIQAGEIKYIQ